MLAPLYFIVDSYSNWTSEDRTVRVLRRERLHRKLVVVERRAKCFNEEHEQIQLRSVCINSRPVRNNEQGLYINKVANIK